MNLHELVANFGEFLCSYCKQGEHSHCAEHNNIYECECMRQNHDYTKAFLNAFNRGVKRLEAMRIV